jgi:hypothetical protein
VEEGFGTGDACNGSLMFTKQAVGILEGSDDKCGRRSKEMG